MPSYLAVGRLTARDVVSKDHSGILFIAWRCLYAELVRGRIENVRPNIKNAYIRTLQMTHTPLVNYGEFWLKWVRKNRGTSKKSHIPEKHQDKKILKQNADGVYQINESIYAELNRLRQ